MYSYEDRIRAVQLYIKLGKRVAATIRQLGYPNKNSLKNWHREYLGVPVACGQGVPLADDRLLRRNGRELVHQHQA